MGVINYERLRRDRFIYQTQFQNAKPFRWVMMDNFLPEEVAQAALDNFPPMENMTIKYDNPHEYKATLSDLSKFPALKVVNDELNSQKFIDFISEITGISDLIGDPENVGGGIHQSGKGSFLDIHADFNYHPTKKYHRRLNILIYLNKGWEPNDGGDLELWDKEVTKCYAKISPIFNRAVIFETTNEAMHGFDKVKTSRQTRKCFATYYYTKTRPEHEISERHTSLFKLRPGQKKRFHLKTTIKEVLPASMIKILKKIKGTDEEDKE